MIEKEKKQNTENNKATGESGELIIKVRKYKDLVELLQSPKKVLTSIIAISVIGILLFCGITLIVLAVKRVYPYSDITTNALGTTTLRSEDKEVSYFLLNSAELWANSGIKVKKGQVITIKSSGKKHTAIHHLVEETKGNKPELSEAWVGTEGINKSEEPKGRDKHRRKYRIFPNANQDVLLMQLVIEGGKPDDRPEWYDTNEKQPKKSNNKFYVVGNKMENIHIEENGTLYFTVNDVVLDDETIIRMALDNDSDTISKRPKKDIIEILMSAYNFRENNNKKYEEYIKTNDTTNNDKLYNDFQKELNTRNFGCKNEAGKDVFGHCKLGHGYGIDSNHIELYGYFMKEYKNGLV